MLVWKSQWLSGKVTAFGVEDCGSSLGLGAEAQSGEARQESPDRGGASPGGGGGGEEEIEGKRSTKKRKKSVV